MIHFRHFLFTALMLLFFAKPSFSMQSDASSYKDLNDAVATLGKSAAILTILSPINLTAPLSIPANITLHVGQGGRIIQGAFDLKISGPFQSPRQTVFSGTGAISFTANSVEEIYPEWWGEDGAAIQSAINSTTSTSIQLGAKSYPVYDTIIITPNTRIFGKGRSATSLVNAAGKWTLQYLSPLTGHRDIDANLHIADLSIYGKFGIRLNQTSAEQTIQANWNKQAAIKNVIIERCTIAFRYGTDDPDADTGKPIKDINRFIAAQGVGVQISKVFNADIRNNLLQGLAIALYLDGSDINNIGNNRFASNGRHAHITEHDTYGCGNKFYNNDVLGNRRVGGIYFNAKFTNIFNNYFETYSRAATHILQDAPGATGYLIHHNRFDNNGQAVTPMLDLSPSYGAIIEANIVNPSNPATPFALGTGNWNAESGGQTLAHIRNNNEQFNLLLPMPRVPHYQYDESSSDLFSSSSPQALSGMSVQTGSPWIYDATDKTYYISTAKPDSTFISMILNKAATTLDIFYTGKRKMADNDLYSIVRLDDGTKIGEGYIRSQPNTTLQTTKVTYIIPPGKFTNRISIEWSNSSYAINSIRLVTN
jgi:hypothetical protein